MVSQSATVDRSIDRRASRPKITTQKSDGNLKKRRSWFGGKPKVDADVPDVPSLHRPTQYDQNRHRYDRLQDDVTGPGTALTTDERVKSSRSQPPEVPDQKLERQRSFFGRKRSQSSTSTTKPGKRKSWFGGRADEDDAPPLPAMPVQLKAQQQEVAKASSSPPQPAREQRSSRPELLQRSKSATSTSSRRSKRRKSWVKSSNPDSEDEHEEVTPPMPPLPALTPDDGELYATDSSVATTRSRAPSASVDPRIHTDGTQHAFLFEDPITHVTRGNSIKAPRPLSGMSMSSRKSYVPKNAASGFLKSTTPNSRRGSTRQSLLEDGEGGVVFLTEEQQKEWDKVKHLMEVMERRQNRGVEGMLQDLEVEESGTTGHERDDDRRRPVHSNTDALAALEFGVAR